MRYFNFDNMKIKPKHTNDFYNSVNYDWLTSNTIPNDEVKYTHFLQVQNEINEQLKEILKSGICLNATKLYKSYLDKNYRELNSINELKNIFKVIKNIESYEDLIITATKLLFINVDTLFDIFVDSNIYSSNRYIIYLTQPSLGLPDRSYYFDDKYANIRHHYLSTISKIYRELYPNLSDKDLIVISTMIFEIEKKFAIIFLGNQEKRNTDAVYNKIKYNDAIDKYPKLRLKLIFDTLINTSNRKIDHSLFTEIIMEHHQDPEIDYFRQLEKLIYNYSIDQWKEYFRFNISLTYINLTNQKMKDIHFNMFNKMIRGQKIPKPEIYTGVSLACGLFYDDISHIYVREYFNDEKKQYMENMVGNIKRATRHRINKLDWMSKETKNKALLKLHNIKLKLGYSDKKTRDYTHIILTSSLIKNMIILHNDNYNYILSKLQKPVDNNVWDISSFVVNAYFNPVQNEIGFPAAILQKPFLDLDKSDIYNYANIGSIISHEIIHGFDDQGSKFDENGVIKNWWHAEDKRKYNEKVERIIEIYNDEGINGKLTAGENIADFGSVVIPLQALQYKLGKLTTNDIKEFYISYAQHWQYLLRAEAAEECKLTDPHAFPHLRVNVPLKHQILFQKVFKIAKGDKMYIEPNYMLTIW